MKEEHRYQGKVPLRDTDCLNLSSALFWLQTCGLTFNYSLVLSALAPDGLMNTVVYGYKKKNNL